MRLLYLFILTISIGLSSCSYGQLTVICSAPPHLKEISAIEYDTKRNVFWVIQDSGNSSNLIAINAQGQITHQLELKDCKNKDWEDLAQDQNGNLYIGDFGNNARSRNTYKIYKVSETNLDQKKTNPELIEFKLPKGMKEQDFESFFIYDEHFYIFSKGDKKTNIYRVPNEKGEHNAKKIGSHEFKGKHNKVTSAAISPDKRIVVLLNGNKLWKLSDFKNDDFFSGDIELMSFNHKSQKEGIGFLNPNEVVVSDERNEKSGGKIYSFKLN